MRFVFTPSAVSLYDPSRENSVWSAPQSATNAKFKIFFPLKMARAKRKPFKIVSASQTAHLYPLLYRRYTGSYSRRKKRGCDCTEVEAAEITLYFNFYKEELKREMEAFMAGFKFKNNLFPDENARCYQEHKGEERERTDEEKRMLKKAAFFAGFMDGKQPPRALIGEPEEED